MRLTLFLLLCLFISFEMKGQAPVPDFTSNVTSGCSPLAVYFADKSSGNPTSWNWDFGPGAGLGLRTGPNPEVTYTQPGTYDVKLTVRNADGINSTTKTAYVTVSASPIVDLSADKTIGCLPATIQFTDGTNPNGGTLASWAWDFGDNTQSTQQSPAHTYTTPGFYNVYLAVKNTAGCVGAANKARYIRIVNGVKADFSFTGPTTCQPPFTVAYTNLTSGPGNLTYNWDLSTSTSTQASPSGTYTTAGNYTIKLSASSDYGCSDVIQKTIPITGSTTSFQTTGGKDSVCLGSSVSFQSTASPVPANVTWDFGDGTSYNGLVPPAKTYTNPGIYAVKMSADFGNCSSTATKNITVSALPAVDFYSANNNSFCKGPAAVVFQILTADVVTALWNFGDGGTSNSATSPVTHTYGAAASGNFAVTLTITDSKGCSGTTTKPNYVNILAPYVTIGGIPAGLCKGQTFTPSFTGGTVDGISSYDWDFGDGSPHSTLSAPSHSYAANGNYPVKLTIITNSGCTGSATSSSPIQVGDAPIVNFDKDKDPVCHSDVVTFTNLSTPVNAPPNAVVWSFGDGTTSTLSTPPPHKFPDTGAYTIKLKVTNNGCSDSLPKVGFVHVLPPVANFGYKITDCNLKTNVTFIDSSINGDVATYGALAYAWNFGDGSATDLTATPIHTYPAVTSYNVQLIVNNNLCHDTITKVVELISDKAAFILDKPVYCRNEKITYSSTNNTSHIKTFNWIVDGVPHVTDQAGYYDGYSVTGSHTVQLITTDINGCSDTSAPQTYSVTGPTVSFGLVANGGCKGSTLTFVDSSKSVGTIKSWTFDFGDGVIKSLTAPFTHQYADTGLYQVKLTVVDDIGCQDSMVKPILITKPISKFSAAQTTFCPGVPLQFTDSSAGKGLSYNWNFGDGQTDIVKNPLHQYSVLRDSTYSVTLVVTDTVGCSDTLVQNNYIKVRLPKALYNVTDTVTFCPPLETKFFFLGKDYESFSWDFGDGGGVSTLTNINHFYNNYGSYKAKLYAVGFGGCIDSATINIAVTNPYTATSVTFNPKTACNNLTVNFTVKAPDSSRYYIYFGDGGVDSLKTSFSHYYNLPNLYSPYILVEDNVGCQIVIGGLGNVDIKGAVPLFGMDKKAFCDNGTVNFTDYSQAGNDPIVTRTWDFGDGSAPQILPGGATYNYTKPGLFVPTLSVTTVAGCTQTYTDTIRVLATPVPVITSVNGVCSNLIINLAGTLLVPPDTAISWKWNLGAGQTSTQPNVSISYSDTGLHHITLEATNSLGCKGDTSKDITVYPAPLVAVSGDTAIIAGGVGENIPLTYSANAASYSWTPAANLSCTDCANPFANPKFTTTYNVIVTDSNGCVTSRNVTLVVVCNNKNFFIPNTFSPNNDGSNDRFYPRGTGLNLIQALRIFNRWGEMVFEKRNFPANDASSGWDGTYKGKPASTDTYVYMIDIICDNANIITYKGNITLIR